MLEGAGTDGSGKRNSPYLYLLWRYDRRRQEWKEMARVWAQSWEWAIELGPLARRALQPVRAVVEVESVAQGLLAMIDAQLDGMEPKE